MPAGLHGRASGESREGRVRFPVLRKRDSSETCLAPDCRAASLNFMANAGEITLATSGFEFRPTSRKAG